MRLFSAEEKYRNWRYQYLIGPHMPPVQLYSLGWQRQQDTVYDWNGRNRRDELGNCIFQYTISGSGILEINGTKQEITEGMAFLSEIPGSHRYYLPASSLHWEFLYVTLTGHYAISQWCRLQERYGNVFTLPEQDPIVKSCWALYTQAESGLLRDGYDTSSAAYAFLMELQEHLPALHTRQRSPGRQLEASVRFMEQNYPLSIALEDIAASAGMSRYYYNHTFTRAYGVSPWRYLSRIRVETAANLLLSTDLSTKEIAAKCGFESVNYFHKVFRKYLSMSPGEFRLQYAGLEHFTLRL